MGNGITIRNLDEAVEQKLREQAARHGRSLEAEVREILTRELIGRDDSLPTSTPVGEATVPPIGKFKHLVGIWKGRMTTDEVMQITRGG